MSTKKKIVQLSIFLVIMLLTFYAVFRKQDLPEICAAAAQMPILHILAAMALGLFFVSAEGMMIWYLSASMGKRCKIGRCLIYSWIGFFYSGITPSATGGQPMQLYYMNRDGCRASDSTVILMTMALAYKLVLVMIGLSILVFWRQPLKSCMQGAMPLYYLGILLNLGVVLAIIGVMLFPRILLKAVEAFEKMLIRIHIWKENPEREKKVQSFVGNYRQAVEFMLGHKNRLIAVMLITILQRCSMFLLTYLIYRGFYLTGESMWKIMALQAAVFIAVDMLPVPGAQGITELVYRIVFQGIFTEYYLVPSMLVCRGMSFYFPLILCGIAAGFETLRARRSRKNV